MLSPGVVLFGQLLCTVGVGSAGRSANTTSVHCNYSLWEWTVFVHMHAVKAASVNSVPMKNNRIKISSYHLKWCDYVAYIQILGRNEQNNV